MAKYDYNLIVIGAGSAGLIASLVSATAGAKTMLVESNQMGGDCLHTGCVPSKTLIASARIAHEVRNASRYGIETTQASTNFPAVMRRVHEAIAQIQPHDSVERYTSLGVDCRRGHARVLDPHIVEVNGERPTTRSIVLATGATPTVPSIPGLLDCQFLTSETLWDLKELPRRLVVLGGGPIGCELAQAFHRLGSKVAIVEVEDQLLPLEDVDVSEVITDVLLSEGVDLYTGWQASACKNQQLTIHRFGRERVLDFDQLLVATGRTPRVKNLGLEEVGINLSAKQTVKVNRYLQTEVNSVFACGDVVGPYQFTHMAAHQAWFASMNALTRPFWRLKLNDKIVPWAIFTDPELARVGVSENDATRLRIPHEVTKYSFAELDRAVAEGTSKGFVKLITKPGKDTLLGACIVGPSAGELISSCINAMRHGYGVNSILSTIHVYPTRMEAVRLAAGRLRRAQAPPSLLKLAERLNALLR
ncbi:MAG: FAD-binding protein [Gammaproteobacteria bacterium]|nr:FAD-binding protein [Gammaproteobacteria bacterium]MYF37282.1 FAD-binding protein [Gammaproteobacteria bacterium]